MNDNNSTPSCSKASANQPIPFGTLKASLLMMIGSKKVWECANVRLHGNVTIFAIFLFLGGLLTVVSSSMVQYGDFHFQGLINYLLFPLSLLFFCLFFNQKNEYDADSKNQSWIYIPAILWLSIDCLITMVGITFSAIDRITDYSFFANYAYYTMSLLAHGVFWWQTLAVFLLIIRKLQCRTFQSVVIFVFLLGWITLFEHLMVNEPIFEYEYTPESYEAPNYISEEAFYEQPTLLADEIKQLGEHKQGQTDWYFLGVAGYGSQNVFNSEINHISKWFDKQVGSTEQSISLINSDNTWTTRPIASKTSIKQSLQRISQQIDVEEDVLFMNMTSHGAEGFISLQNKPMSLDDLDAKWLKETLDETGIRWRVIVVSACHSGSFIDEMMTPHTLIITASTAEKMSFGCSNEADFTYFGKAFFVDSLPHATSFQQAFAQADTLIHERESEKKYEHSEPQIAIGEEMKKALPRLEKALLEANPDKEH